MPPWSKNGSKINSLVSLNTFDGGGSAEPARRQTSSQTSINSAMTTSGGMTRTAVSRAMRAYVSARGGRLGVIATTGAATEAGAAVSTSIFVAGMFIEIPLRLQRMRPPWGGRRLHQTSTRLIASDFR